MRGFQDEVYGCQIPIRWVDREVVINCFLN